MHRNDPIFTTDQNGLARRIIASPDNGESRLSTFFRPGIPVVAARAPGRLDILGGIADYSGGLVLELPIQESTIAAIQRSEEGLEIVSRCPNEGFRQCFSISPSDWHHLLASEMEVVRREVAKYRENSWVGYLIGPLVLLAREYGLPMDGGLRILVESTVPVAKGVSSSAALEVATMRAAAALFEHPLEGLELARLCQQAENRIVGAPCGIMDQVTSALGRADQLIAIRCQPASTEGFLPIPTGMRFWGIDSGTRHSISGNDYGAVRTGTFMGYRMIAQMEGLRVHNTKVAGRVRVEDPRWGGYLANIASDEFVSRFEPSLPEQISGAEFLETYGGITDNVTLVDPEKDYPIRRPTSHPIEENTRVCQFRDCLQARVDHEALIAMGKLMVASHESYSACGLGSQGTDRLVELVLQAGHEFGLYGAKITGGGSGGAIAVFGRADAEAAVQDVANTYAKETGHQIHVFSGSSDGACLTDPVRFIPKEDETVVAPG